MSNQEKQNFLGIDWGERKIGLALAHAETRVALPYGILINDATLFEQLTTILQDEAIDTVIVGVPSGRGEAEHPATTFGRTLEEKLHVSVKYQNEMFTSKLAQGNLLLQGHKEVSQGDDAEAAKIILQDWLDNHSSPGS